MHGLELDSGKGNNKTRYLNNKTNCHVITSQKINKKKTTQTHL